MRKIRQYSNVVPCNLSVSFENTTEKFPSNCFLSILAPDRLQHMQCGLSLESSYSTSPNGGCNYVSKCLANDNFFLLKRVNTLTKMWSSPQRNMCFRVSWKRSQRMQFTTLEADFLERAWSKEVKCWSSNSGLPGASFVTLVRQIPPSL